MSFKDNPKGQSIISIEQFNREDLDYILKKSKIMDDKPFDEKWGMLDKSIVALLFYEPSTRTSISFQTAARGLGAATIFRGSSEGLSVKKKEDVYDTIRTIASYGKHAPLTHIVMRNPFCGSAFEAEAAVLENDLRRDVMKKELHSLPKSIPLLNGGDGSNEHPTQTILDLYSIKQAREGSIDGTNIAMVGDLKYGRTTRSLAKALSLYDDVKIHLVAPDFLQLNDDTKDYLNERGQEFHLHKKIEDVINEIDIFYMTRIQAERFSDPAEYEKAKGFYILTGEMLEKAKDSMKIMHPLPRVEEIKRDLDNTSFSYYFEQAGNGIPTRQALLYLTAKGDFE